MIRIHLSTEDIIQTRFAFSALWEVAASYRCLINPERHALHLPWIKESRRLLRDVDLSLLDALIRPFPLSTYTPDFLTPTPTTLLPNFSDEIEVLRNTPPDILRREVSQAYAGDEKLPDVVQRYLTAPKTALDHLADVITTYWERVIAPHWPRLRALLEGDVLYRAYNLATQGPEAMFADLHPQSSYSAGHLEINKTHNAEVDPKGRGMLLIPVAFCWPDLYVIIEPPWPVTLAYSPRGLGGLWVEDRPPTSEGLKLLMGEGRAAVIKSLLVPSTTNQLAHQLGVTPGAVSQQLALLKQSKVIESFRRGRHVFYRLSPAGYSLLKIFDDLE